jgi:hypothetical protein
MKIFLDIETIPLGAEPVYEREPFAGVKVPANYKDPIKISEYKGDKYEKALKEHEEEQDKKAAELLHEWKKGALKATKSQIVCICAITDDNRSFSLAINDESYLLWEFDFFLTGMSFIEWVGHNVNFDLQMLRTHAAKHSMKNLVDSLTFEKWAKDIHDTMQMWAGVRFDDKTKLTEIAEFLGIENLNGDTTGGEIYDLYKAGKFEEIQTKCMNDVLMCKEVYERIS